MKASLASIAALLALAGGASPQDAAPAGLFESPVPPAPQGEIDRLVFAKLSSLGIRPVGCSDAVFVRRAYLDAIGTLPSADEAREFLKDPDAKNKRRLLIDRLLERPEFADYWAMKWGDVLRIKAEFPVNLWPNAAQAYHRWVRASIAENKPYDRFARELLTSSGSNFRAGPVNFYRAVQSKTPETIASAVALVFMGSRTDAWPPDRLKGMAAFFSQIGYKPTAEWKEEIVFWDPLQASRIAGNTAPGQDAVGSTVKAALLKPQGGAPPPAVPETPAGIFPDGTKAPLIPDRDPREIFADWLITPRNPWFTRSIANRIWGWLLGRGIVHEPDDLRPDNPPSNPALLAYLEKELSGHAYDLKHLYRLILNSATYQLSSLTRSKSKEAETHFATYPLRRLDAEVLIDAINRITGASDLYTSPIPEPFTNIPRDRPAVAIADGSITSPFLALFGRPARATGMLNERDNKPLPAQWLYLLNSTQVQQKLEGSQKLRAIIASGRSPRETLEELYLTILSRLPTEGEAKAAEGYGAVAAAPAGRSGKTGRSAAGAKKREDWLDIAWALMNTTEFLYRH
jgi:hypothetical protein